MRSRVLNTVIALLLEKRAVDICQRLAKEPCRLYAVDNSIVWN